MSEKTEKATSYKLQKAKEQGQVDKSVELNTSLNLLVIFAVFLALGQAQFEHFKTLMHHLLNLTGRMHFTVENIIRINQYLLNEIIISWIPLAFTIIITLILVTIAQTGVVWSFKSLKPDVKRLSIIKGFKRLFSIKVLFDVLKNSLKLIFIMVLLHSAMCKAIPQITQFIHLKPVEFPAHFGSLLSKMSLQLLVLLSGLAIMDKLYTRWKYGKDQRMTKQEVKDEYKQREGDPRIKSKIKQLQNALRKKTASLDNVKNADVIITNPTHLAVALQYQRGIMPAPKLLCKAAGEQVQLVKKIARQNNIPIIENKIFARALFQSIEINQWITPNFYPVAAGIFSNLGSQRSEV